MTGGDSDIQQFTYGEWKKRQKKLNEKIDNGDNPLSRTVANLMYGIQLNHKIIEEVQGSIGSIQDSVKNIEKSVGNTGITRKDIKLVILFASSVLVPIITLLLKIWW